MKANKEDTSKDGDVSGLRGLDDTSSIRKELWRDNLFRIVFEVLATVASLTVLAYLLDFYNFIFLSIPIFIFIYVRHSTWIRREANQIFMSRFADSKGWKYHRDMPVDDLRGALFKMGYHHDVNSVVSGKLHNRAIRVFYYTMDLTEQKEGSYTYGFTVVELSFDGVEFPHTHLLFRDNSEDFAERFLSDQRQVMKSRRSSNEVELPLDDEFRDSFTLLSKEGYEIEITQIFTPELLRFIKEKGMGFDIELVDDRMYIYEGDFVSSGEQLQEIDWFASEMVRNMGPLIKRLEKDFNVLHQYYKQQE